MDSRAVRFTLIQIRDAIELSQAPGFRNEARVALPPFGMYEAKSRLDAVLADPSASPEQQHEARTLQQMMREKFRL